MIFEAHPPLEGVLFDLDGTLLDTLDDLVASANHALAIEGLPDCDPLRVRQQISGGAYSMMSYWLTTLTKETEALAYPALNRVPEKHQALLERMVDQMLDHYALHPARHTRFFEGMEDVLLYLEQRGIPWGIVTNKRTRFTTPLAKSLNLASRTPCIVSGDTTPKSKPHPLPLFKAAEILDLDPKRCVYIGDAAKDIEAGKKAGMRTIAAGYGYVPQGQNPELWGAEKTLQQPTDLIPWIREHAA